MAHIKQELLEKAIERAKVVYELLEKAESAITLGQLDPMDQSSAQSMIQQYVDRQSLSYKQYAYLSDILGRATIAREKLEGNFLPVYMAFQLAGDKMINPRMFFTVGGVKVVLSLYEKVIYIKQKGTNLTYGAVNVRGNLYIRSWALNKPEWPAILQFLQDLSSDSLQAARAWAAKSGMCLYCGAELTDPPSKQAGYGPVCAKHWNLPWGEVKYSEGDVLNMLDELKRGSP